MAFSLEIDHARLRGPEAALAFQEARDYYGSQASGPRGNEYRGICMLLDAVPSPAFLASIYDRCDGVGGGDICPSFLGFIEDYKDYAAVIERHLGMERTVVVDVGCAYGFQHVLFQKCLAYVGIDYHASSVAEPAFTPNAVFWQGDFNSEPIQERLAAFLAEKEADVRAGYQERRAMQRVLHPMEGELRVVGIANMSILYQSDERVARSLDAMHRTFQRMFIM